MSWADEGLDQIMLTGERGGGVGVREVWWLIFRGGGAGVIRKKESPDFRFPEVDISVYLSYGELMESEAIYQVHINGGAVVRALASHQCSNPGVDAMCGLSLLLVLSFALRGFSPGTLVFPSPQKPTFPNSNLTRNQVDEEPLTDVLFCFFLRTHSVPGTPRKKGQNYHQIFRGVFNQGLALSERIAWHWKVRGWFL